VGALYCTPRSARRERTANW